jgi:hypothetical protein
MQLMPRLFLLFVVQSFVGEASRAGKVWYGERLVHIAPIVARAVLGPIPRVVARECPPRALVTF